VIQQETRWNFSIGGSACALKEICLDATRMRSGRLSFFAATSWLVPIFVFLIMQPYIDAVTAHDGNWLPGIGAKLARLGVAAGLAFSLGLLSIILRERLSWIGAIPCLVGGLYVLWYACVMFREFGIGRSVGRAMQNAPHLTVGILMVLNGVFFLAWLLPRASARVVREQQADGIGEKEARMKTKAVKLFGIATLFVGVVFILVHAFEFF
jgi:hypothetical protein